MRIDYYKRKLNYDGCYANCSNKIWIFWNNVFEVEILDDNAQFVNAKVQSSLCKEEVIVTAVYASCNITTRRQLWEGLVNMSMTTSPWVVMGDFNVIKGPSEQVRCKALDPKALEDFNDCLLSCRLEDAGYTGKTFSWTNGRTAKRLDRVLFNQQYGALYPRVKVQQLAKTLSDHAPLLVTSFGPEVGGKGSFKFQKMWFHHPNFIRLVEESWGKPIHGNPLYVLGAKLKRLKKDLKEWNKNIFGNVFNMVENADEEVQECEAEYEKAATAENREALHRARAHHFKCLAIEEDFLSQQSGIKWLQEGDRNSGFYHNFVRRKRKRSAVLGILDEGEWLTEPEEIAISGVNFFQSLFTQDTAAGDVELIDCIPPMVSDEDNEQLLSIPNLEEVKQVVFSLNKESVAGPDGFNGHFFHNFWDLIAGDMLQAVRCFLAGNPLHKGFTSTAIALIPKGDNPKSWKDYRPISLCSFVNKVMSKLISSRLAQILPKLISEVQAGFVKGRLIQDNILLAQELIHHIDKGSKAGNVILNLDMSKAFDKLSWSFLEKILRRMGFSEIWIGRVMACINNNWFSIIINGKSEGFFKSGKGVRQGDPLSPALFILAEEYLFRGLQHIHNQHPEIAYHSGCSVKVPALGFADDVLIFSSGTKSALSKVIDFLDHYQLVSGQMINREKSSWIISNKATPTRCSIVQKVTGFRKGAMPFTYLGIPIYKGKKQIFLFDGLIEKIREKLQSWGSNFLSFGGRIALLQSVLTTLPMYFLQVMQMPAAVYNKIEIIFNKFLWDGMTWCKWSKACAPYAEGGLNMRSLPDIHQAFMQKAWFRMREGNCLWSKFMLSKYCKTHHPRLAPVHPSHSRVWKSLHKVRDEAESKIHWQIGRGMCDFWMDSWLELGPLCTLYSDKKGGKKVHELWINGGWDEAALSNLISHEHMEKVKEVYIEAGSPDKAIWKASPDGLFSFKSTYDDVREHRQASALYSVIWHNNIPKKMSFVVWRLLNGWLPVDEMMVKKGIALASKCVCCAQEETINHVFFTNPIAQQLWSYFAGLLGKRSTNIQSLQQVLRNWSLSVSTAGHIKQVTPVVILWALWEARNKAKHVAVPYTFERMRGRIMSLLTMISRANLTLLKFWTGDTDMAKKLGAHCRPVRINRPLPLCWEKPMNGAIKLNIDAAFKDGRGGYGGILRNDKGQLLVAMGFQGSCATALDAEIQALLICLQECVSRGHTRMQIEIDSIQLVQMVHGKIAHWQHYNRIAHIAALLLSSHSSLSHVFREKNMAADWIAKQSWKKGHHIIWEADTKEIGMHRLLQLEMSGHPQIRMAH
ncbi:reverse transcriptase [Lithospermum erythrorhizon]|uniref:Reverse transcriptase n=1 Tax=Lithospermum erythrorhizon TaxID=34254 RepID=A0AAV3Q941_LITER